MKKTGMNLADYYRAGNVDRWQIVQTSRPQNLAEHSFQVALIAWNLYDRLMSDRRIGCEVDDPKPIIIQRDLLFRWAILHDMPEVLTGDMASILKNFIRDKYNRLANTTDDDPFDFVEGALSEEYKALREEVEINKLVKIIVKLADLIEAIKFLAVNAHTSHGKKVQSNIIDNLQKSVKVAEGKYHMFNWDNHVHDVLAEISGPETHLDDLLGESL